MSIIYLKPCKCYTLKVKVKILTIAHKVPQIWTPVNSYTHPIDNNTRLKILKF